MEKHQRFLLKLETDVSTILLPFNIILEFPCKKRVGIRITME